jgi:hypothetical protein
VRNIDDVGVDPIPQEIFYALIHVVRLSNRQVAPRRRTALQNADRGNRFRCRTPGSDASHGNNFKELLCRHADSGRDTVGSEERQICPSGARRESRIPN